MPVEEVVEMVPDDGSDETLKLVPREVGISRLGAGFPAPHESLLLQVLSNFVVDWKLFDDDLHTPPSAVLEVLDKRALLLAKRPFQGPDFLLVLVLLVLRRIGTA